MNRQAIFRWVKYWPAVLTAFATIGFSVLSVIPDVKKEGWPWVKSVEGLISASSTVALLAGSVGAARQTYESESLKAEKSALQESFELERTTLQENSDRKIGAKYLLEILLMNLSERLNFQSTERVSLYKYDPSKEGGCLVPAGRYSSNPEYCGAKRLLYSLKEGCIGEAWREGQSIVDDLPSPCEDFELYVDASKGRFSMNKNTIRELSMKSWEYIAYRISDKSDPQNGHVGVIVFESTRQGIIDNGMILDLLEEPIYRLLPWFIERVPLSGFAEVREDGL